MFLSRTLQRGLPLHDARRIQAQPGWIGYVPLAATDEKLICLALKKEAMQRRRSTTTNGRWTQTSGRSGVTDGFGYLYKSGADRRKASI
jgi:hypothetical protein